MTPKEREILDAAKYQIRRLAAENGRLVAEVGRLRGMLDLLCAPPMTAEEAEAALDALDPADCPAIPPGRIAEMVAYATNPDNATAEWQLDRLLEAAESCPGFDPEALERARSWRKRSLCL
jgi:hypothetical protein